MWLAGDRVFRLINQMKWVDAHSGRQCLMLVRQCLQLLDFTTFYSNCGETNDTNFIIEVSLL